MKTNKITNKTCWKDNYSESEKQEFVEKMWYDIDNQFNMDW